MNTAPRAASGVTRPGVRRASTPGGAQARDDAGRQARGEADLAAERARARAGLRGVAGLARALVAGLHPDDRARAGVAWARDHRGAGARPRSASTAAGAEVLDRGLRGLGVGRLVDAPDQLAGHDHPVGDRADGGHVGGRADAEARPRAARRSRARARARKPRSVVVHLHLAAGDAGHRDAVDEARRPRGRSPPAAPSSVVGAASGTTLTPGPARLLAHLGALVDRQVGDDHAGHPGARGALHERARPGGQHDVDVGHQHHRRPAAHALGDRDHVLRPGAVLEGPLPGGLDRRARRRAGPRRGCRARSGRRGGPAAAAWAALAARSGIAAHHVRHEQRAAGVRRRRRGCAPAPSVIDAQGGPDGVHVLVPAARQAHQHRPARALSSRALAREQRERVRALERRDDPLARASRPGRR